MEPEDNKAGKPERRRSSRAPVRVSVDNGDEEYDLAMVADGFRPTHAHGPSRPSTPSLTSASSATLFAEESSASSLTGGRPSSTAKPPGPQFSISVRHDANALTRQTTNSTNSTVFIPHDSPYQGPSGASHPYQMYTQNVRPARTLSMATSSTMPMSESSYRGPRGPSHPYGLYPQNDSIEPDAVQAAAIPLGFRGLPDQYQRRVGPEGEEVGDMIGPDGHQEQLPPYSRYPDEAYVRKAVAVDGSPDAVHGAAVVSPILTTSASAIPTIHGAGGIGLATRNPEFESTDDLDSPRSRHSTRSFTSDDSGRRIRLDDEGISEKREPPKKWQAWMRRKVCGIIPYWAMCLTAIVLVVMMVVLGAVIGTFAANKQKRPPRKDGAWQPPYDATPIPPPPDLQPLATGTFGLPLMTNRVSNTCFANPTLSQAWNCHLVISGMTLRVTKEKDDYLASLDCNHSFTMMNNVYSYGEQPPLIPKPVTLDLVEDKFEPSRGPAWFQAVSFNKTVILPEGWLGSSGGDSKKMARHAASIGTSISNFKRKGIAQPGDKPWVCSWPNTYLELFIYAQQNSSYSNWGKPPSTPSSSTATESPTTPPPNPAPSHTDGSESSSHDDNSYPPPRTTTTESKYKPYYPPPQDFARSPPPFNTETSTSTSTATATSSNPFGPIDTGNDFPPLPQPYPRVIKLEERRVSTQGAPRAQCTQIEIRGPGEEARPFLGPDGRPVVVDIDESEPFGPPPAGVVGGAPTSTATATAVPDYVRKRSGEYGWEAQVGGGVFGRDGGGGGGGPPDISPCGCIWYLT